MQFVTRSEDGGFHLDGYYWSLLHVAVYDRNITLLQNLLLKHTLDLNVVDNQRRTPLHWAALPRFNQPVNNTYYEGALLLEDHRLKCIDAQDKYGNTPLMHAVRNQNKTAIKALVAHKANPNIANKELTTPAHVAAQASSIKFLELLLGTKKVNIAATDNKGNTLLHYAIEQRSLNFLKLLFKHDAQTTLYKTNQANLTPFEGIFFYWDPDKAYFLLNKSYKINYINPKTGRTALHTAVGAKFSKYIADFLLTNGANALIQDNQGYTPLHLTRNPITAQSLLVKGAQITIQNHDGDTPLHCALQNSPNNEQLIQTLLSQRADVNIQNNEGNTPLHFALQASPPNEQVIQTLLSQGADVNIQDNEGNTPLHTMIDTYYCYRRSTDKSEYDFLYTIIIPLVLNEPADFNKKNKTGATLLHQACGKDLGIYYDHNKTIDRNLIELLLLKGALRSQDKKNKYPEDYTDNKEIITMVKEGLSKGTATRERLFKKYQVPHYRALTERTLMQTKII